MILVACCAAENQGAHKLVEDFSSQAPLHANAPQDPKKLLNITEYRASKHH